MIVVRMLSILCVGLLVAGCAGTGSGSGPAVGTSKGTAAVRGFAERMTMATTVADADVVAAEFSKAVSGNREAALEELKSIAMDDKELRKGALSLLSRNLRASEYGQLLLKLPDSGR